ncbi:MAG: signal recognition particle-docking protein FtsY [Alphaproteobacteria bacterium]
MTEAPSTAGRGSWFKRLRQGLRRSSSRLADGIGQVFASGRVDDRTLDALEDLLIEADLGPETAMALREKIARLNGLAGADAADTARNVREALADEIAGIVEPVAVSLDVPAGHRPFVILVVGVNGSGKTTSVGKLAHLFGEAGQKVKIAACDTFRAAASEQLMLWGERAGAQVLSAPPGSDASGLAYQSLQEARADGTDVLLIDTAGRLQNRADLMAELQKIRRVLQKQDETAPHAVLLVLDATTGQNAHSQVEIFREMVDVTGLALTKLDGSAKGGVLVGLARRFGLPVHAIGVGEGVDDLRPFEARAFARGLLDLDDA